MTSVTQRLDRVRQRIANACTRSGRDPSSVTLIGVTKQVPVDVIQEAVALGLTDLGENRVQEARIKHVALGHARELLSVRWHLIGHLQRNKVKDAVALFDAIHSIDSVALAQALEHQAVQQGRQLDGFIQVNVAGETTKFGCRPDEVVSLAQTVSQLPHLTLVGLMTIAPFAEDPETARPVFQQLRELRDMVVSTCHLSPVTCQLSMGMSQDFEVAIEEGADVVRVGTAIFEKRD